MRTTDAFSLASAARPAELSALLSLARGRRLVAELGTGTAWSAIALVLADPRRSVVSYDPIVRPERERYLALAGSSARDRIELRAEPDTRGPRHGESFELLFIDSDHHRQPVEAAFAAWRHAVAPGGVVVFHDYGHPDYPGVGEAIAALGLSGEDARGLFIWHAPG